MCFDCFSHCTGIRSPAGVLENRTTSAVTSIHILFNLCVMCMREYSNILAIGNYIVRFTYQMHAKALLSILFDFARYKMKIRSVSTAMVACQIGQQILQVFICTIPANQKQHMASVLEFRSIFWNLVGTCHPMEIHLYSAHTPLIDTEIQI